MNYAYQFGKLYGFIEKKLRKLYQFLGMHKYLTVLVRSNKPDIAKNTYIIMFQIKQFQIFQIVVTLTCAGIFLIMTTSQLEVFNMEPTGTSLKWKSVKSLPFPAFTICDHNFYYGRAFDEVPFPRGIFSTRPKQIQAHPYEFYRSLDAMTADITSAMWEYYFTLDDILYDITNDFGQGLYCRVGEVSCSYDTISVTKPNDTHMVVETEVPAGIWASKFLADSYIGTTYLCHTLITNVTVDFSLPEGNSIALKWRREYSSLTNYWTLYIHDKNEHVLLNSYAIETLPSLTISKLQPGENDYKVKRKAQLLPRLLQLPEPSDVLPCSPDENYSLNLCNIKQGWKRRSIELEDYHGSKFNCELPGILSNLEDQKPICKETTTMSNATLGYFDLMKHKIHGIRDKPLLTEPPIGVYKETSNCMQRCSLYTYSLVEEVASEYDSTMDLHDLYLYFASSTVETWTEYRLNTKLDFLANLGGSLGLILGMSLLSMIFTLTNSLSNGVSVLSKYFRVSQKDLRAKKDARYSKW